MTCKILLVDDEEGVLSSLKRLFLDEEYEILTAGCGTDAINVLKNGPVDVIISDQRMPKMSGAEFLRLSKEYSPDSVRIILTGYADIAAAIDSINKGEVYRYLTKPWNDEEIRSIIRDTVEIRRLRKENENLLELTQRQNLELKDLNVNLEEKVKVQTEEIRGMLDKLKGLYGKLDKSFMDTVVVISNIIRLKERIATSSKNVSTLAKRVAEKLKLPESYRKDIEMGAMLRDIGKIGINDSVLAKAFTDMTPPERVEYMKHPVLGQAAIQSIENMQDAGIIIRHHHERWNGEGYPNNLEGDKIPTGSRVISIASDYYELLSGILMPRKFTKHEAKQFIIEGSGIRYDPDIVIATIQILDKYEVEIEEEGMAGLRVLSSELRPGMVLLSDIYTTSGLLLLNKGMKITEKHIYNIINFERSDGKRYDIHVDSRPDHQRKVQMTRGEHGRGNI